MQQSADSYLGLFLLCWTVAFPFISLQGQFAICHRRQRELQGAGGRAAAWIHGPQPSEPGVHCADECGPGMSFFSSCTPAGGQGRVAGRYLGQGVVISVDGWTGSGTLPIVGFCMQGVLLRDRLDLFLPTLSGNLVKVVELDKPHTIEHLTSATRRVLDEVEVTYGVRVVGLVTDSAANMIGMRLQIAGVRHGVSVQREAG